MTLNMRKLSALSYELDGNKMKIKEVVVISELQLWELLSRPASEVRFTISVQFMMSV